MSSSVSSVGRFHDLKSSAFMLAAFQHPPSGRRRKLRSNRGLDLRNQTPRLQGLES
jgi:hypothetical protein